MDQPNPTLSRAEALFQKLVDSLERGDSAQLTRYLAAMRRFHRYSLHNVMLIIAQRPDATQVAGYRTWQQLNRQVRRGEKGIAILAPLVRQAPEIDDDGQPVLDRAHQPRTEPVVYGWKTVCVFDVTQTEGEPLYTPPATTGSVGPYFGKLCEVVRMSGVELTFVDDLGGALGRCRPGSSVALLTALDPPTAFCVLAHEYAHHLLHQRDGAAAPPAKTVRETEAEAVAAIVAEAAGLDHLTSAHDYIRLYSGSADLLRASLHRIQRASAHILAALQLDA